MLEPVSAPAWLEAALGAVLQGSGPAAEPRSDGGRLPPWQRALLRDLVGLAKP